MRVGRMVYWFVTGACFGLAVDLYGGGLFPCAVGVILLLVGVFAQQGREAVTAILGFGAGSAVLLILLTKTNFQGGPPVPLVVYGGLVISILSAVIGLVALVVVWRTPQRGAGPTAN